MTYSPTAFQLTHLLQEVYTRLEQTKTLMATGGSTSTVVDSTLSSSYLDNSFVGYTVFITRDAGGAGAAPEGEYSRCSAYTSGTITMGTLTGTVSAGDQVTLARGSMYPLQDVIRLCNHALQKFGAVRQMDTTLTTGTAQTEYAVPMAAKGRVYGVMLQTDTDDANDNGWTPIQWDIIPASSGGTETIRIAQYASGYDIGLLYDGVHAVVSAYDSPISEYIPRDLVVSACALEVANWKSNINPDPIPKLIQDYNEARALAGFKPPENKPKWFIAGE